MSTPGVSVRVPGPWTHKTVGASGAEFHVVVAGDEPDRHTVALLHDFPLHWYSWRDQIQSLSQAGYRVVAIDLRGFGASDYQPGDVDLPQLGHEVTGVLRATGTGPCTVVGAGMGGSVAWMIAHQDPEMLRSVVTICAPHPSTRYARSAPQAIAARRVEREVSISPFKQRNLQNGSLVRRVLKTWCAPDSIQHMGEVSPTYEEPMKRAFAASSALETLRGSKRNNLATQRELKEPVQVPVWSISGGWDGRVPVSAYAMDARGAGHPVTHVEIAEAGHFPNEETPDTLSSILLDHLRTVVQPS